MLRQYVGSHDGVDITLPDGSTVTAVSGGKPVDLPDEIAAALTGDDWRDVPAEKPAGKKPATTEET